MELHSKAEMTLQYWHHWSYYFDLSLRQPNDTRHSCPFGSFKPEIQVKVHLPLHVSLVGQYRPLPLAP